MLSYIWPVSLVVLSNIAYHICTKSVPNEANPFASLAVTYVVGAILSGILYFITGRPAEPLKELSKINWSSYVLGLVIIGLELGSIYAYKAGWPVSTASIVESAFLAVALILVGFILYREPITWNKAVGIVICLAGLAVINWK